uniref:Uncharacterized protein n=1 Tax=viral metagenome TaxID=1070528 RepID=A0A6M3XUE7_9ZZZZ
MEMIIFFALLATCIGFLFGYYAGKKVEKAHTQNRMQTVNQNALIEWADSIAETADKLKIDTPTIELVYAKGQLTQIANAIVFISFDYSLIRKDTHG